MNEFGVDTSFANYLTQEAVDDIEFFIHRIGTLGTLYSGTSAYYNKTLNPDAACLPNIQLVQNTNNKPAGVYFFSYAWNNQSAEVEADKVCDILDAWGFNPHLGVYLDWENTGSGTGSYENLINIGITPTSALLQGFFKAWCDRVRSRGYQPGFYTSEYIASNFLTNTWIQQQRQQNNWFWLAQWYVAVPSLDCDIWQYDDDEPFHGIVVDYDKCMDDRVLKHGIPIWLKLYIAQRGEQNAKCTILL